MEEPTRSVLSYRPFLFLLLARSVSVFAYQMTMVAVAWQLYQITDSALALGLVGLVQFASLAAFTIPVGHVSDRYDRRNVIRICQLGSACAAAVLVAGSLGGWLGSYAIYAVVFVIASMRAFDMPAMQAIMPNLMPAADVSRGTAWFMSAQKTATIVGPAIGGFLYIPGPEWVYGVSMLFWLAASVSTMFIVMQGHVRGKEPVTLESMFAGFRFLVRNRIIFGTATLDMFAVMLGSVTILLPIFARDVLQAGPEALGLLRSSPAAGALLMSLVLARYPLKPPIGPTLFRVIVLFGIATVGFAFSEHLVPAMIALAVMGGSDVVSAVIRLSIVQLRTPDEMRGRVGAANAFFFGSANQLGDFRSGVVAAMVGAVPAVLIGGVCTIAVTVVWMMYLFPEIYRIHTLESDEKSKPKAAPAPTPA